LAEFTIGEIAEEFGVTLRTLRFYEQRGLVHPARTGGRQRLYSDSDRERLREILLLRKLGFTLTEITRGGIDQAQLEGQLGLLIAQKAELEEAIALLQELIAPARRRRTSPRHVAADRG
jgi:DNA-binding transcriptional MerR regulator